MAVAVWKKESHRKGTIPSEAVFESSDDFMVNGSALKPDAVSAHCKQCNNSASESCDLHWSLHYSLHDAL